MLHDMARGVYSAEILRAGGVLALSQVLGDGAAHERVRVAAAGALSVLMADGAIAVEAARAGALPGLLAMLSTRSPRCRRLPRRCSRSCSHPRHPHQMGQLPWCMPLPMLPWSTCRLRYALLRHGAEQFCAQPAAVGFYFDDSACSYVCRGLASCRRASMPS